MNIQNIIFPITVMVPRKFSLFEHLLVVVFLLAVAAVFIWLIKKEIKQRGTGKKVLCDAVVLSKAVDKCVSQPVLLQGRYPDVGLVESEMVYSVLFQTEEGSELRFQTARAFHDHVSEGQKDTLIYKGNSLIQFGHLSNKCKPGGADFKGIHGKL